MRIQIWCKFWKVVYGRVENIVGRENADYQLILFFAQCFQRLFLQGHLNLGLCDKELKRGLVTYVLTQPLFTAGNRHYLKIRKISIFWI